MEEEKFFGRLGEAKERRFGKDGGSVTLRERRRRDLESYIALKILFISPCMKI